MSISRDLVRRLAHLARLEIDDAEVDAMTRDLGVVLDYAARLTPSADEVAVPPAAAGMPLRDDTVEPWPLDGSAVDRAPEGRDGFFRVPPAIEGR